MKKNGKSSEFIRLVKEFFKTGHYLWLYLGSLIIMAGSYFLFFNQVDFNLIPKQGRTFFYTDQNDGGNSIIDTTRISDRSTYFRFMLKKGFVAPYAGLNISPGSTTVQKLDLSPYNRLEIKLTTQNIPSLFIYLTLKDHNVKDTSNKLQYRHMGNSIETSEGINSFKLEFKKFITPDWWYTVIGQPKSEFSDPDWSSFQQVAIVTGINPVVDKTSTIEVAQIRFYRDNTFVIIMMVLAELAIVVGCFFLFYFKKRKNKKIQIHYKAIQEGELTKSGYNFLDYIHANFTDSDLNLEEVSKNSGVATRYISDTISEKFGCNFKTYINQIRISESKRLLKETNLNINEVAYKVGFSSPGSMNRVFKTMTGMTPSEYKQSPL